MKPLEVIIDPSQHPETVRRQLLDGLSRREVPAKFLYETRVQAAKWIAVHHAFSPACRDDSEVRSIYREVCERVAGDLNGSPVDVVGLGCGSGHKEAALVQALCRGSDPESGGRPAEVRYVPADVSLSLVQSAVQALEGRVGSLERNRVRPWVIDFVHAGLAEIADCCADFLRDDAVRVVTFFGMLPNLPQPALAGLALGLRPGDVLILSANLIREDLNPEALAAVLAQYDNPPTADWLWAFMESLGVNRGQGAIRFAVESNFGPLGWVRVRADFVANQDLRLSVEGEIVDLQTGEPLTIFISHRQTPSQMLALFESVNLELVEGWISEQEGEGVYYARAKKVVPSGRA